MDPLWCQLWILPIIQVRTLHPFYDKFFVDIYRGQNSHFSPAMENGELIGVLTATKFIKPNQEIFVDYGARYYLQFFPSKN